MPVDVAGFSDAIEAARDELLRAELTFPDAACSFTQPKAEELHRLTSLWSVFALTVWGELRSLRPFQKNTILQLFILIMATLAITAAYLWLRVTHA